MDSNVNGSASICFPFVASIFPLQNRILIFFVLFSFSSKKKLYNYIKKQKYITYTK